MRGADSRRPADEEASLPDDRQFLRRTRALAALPARFTAFEQRQGAFEEEMRAHQAELRERRDELVAALSAIREESREIRRLVEARVLAEAEATELVGKLLQRADARLEALERDPASRAR